MLARTKIYCVGLCLFSAAAAVAADPKSPAKIDIAGGMFHMTAPADWVRKQPRTRIVEHEFAIPASEGDKNDGRMTVMAAGGGVDANIDRWFGQFTQPDGGSTKQRAKVKKIAVAGQDVHLVDISGTFKDQAGPWRRPSSVPSIGCWPPSFQTKGAGDYYIKFYGPQQHGGGQREGVSGQ